MRDPNWYPKGTYYNIYNRRDFERGDEFKGKREHTLWWVCCCCNSVCDNSLFKQIKLIITTMFIDCINRLNLSEYQVLMLKYAYNDSYDDQQYAYKYHVHTEPISRSVAFKHSFQCTAPLLQILPCFLGLTIQFLDDFSLVSNCSAYVLGMNFQSIDLVDDLIQHFINFHVIFFEFLH